MKQLGHDGEHAAEMARTGRALECVRDRAGDHTDDRLTGGGIHRHGVRHEQAVDSARFGEPPVTRQVTRIAGEVFAGTELEWIDEDADDDAVGELARAIHEAQMAFVEISHCGNEADGVTTRALGARPGAHLGQAR